MRIIVILALNGLSVEYNTFKCVIRGRDNVISLKEFHAQLLAEEAIIESSQGLSFSTAMFAKNQDSNSCASSSGSQGGFHSGFQTPNGFHGNYGQPSFFNGDSGASNHMTNDLNNLPLASPYPHNETVQTVNGEDLTNKFDIKDLGSLHFFLGIQISHTDQGLFLSQEKYVANLLKKTKMMDAKPAATPCLPYSRLLKDNGQPFNNPALYRSVVGTLQYLIFTRPDIAFSVHQVSQFMQVPMVSHFTTVKCILRYLKRSLSQEITYSKQELFLKAFSDTDWVGDPNDRQFTTGLVVFLRNNPISWSSKKQQTTFCSSTEVKYKALSSTAVELDWIQ
ncbi:uncharacterized mitochondrial protein AtMg00810-like [Pyrus x bretschneideri]|uniref:uncharacterized mitochondrial protein AtMg00810-like n=1 Tax=Pyrus x bretschneideri TaxID=225117 RepID=UPI00203077F9|nr:uncharacterized mitochondrial protein AtMg00810-like [Pyrus x bretschneideri]